MRRSVYIFSSASRFTAISLIFTVVDESHNVDDECLVYGEEE